MERERSLSELVGRRVAVRGPGEDGTSTYVNGRVTAIVPGDQPILVIDAGGTPPKVFWVPFAAPLVVCVEP